MATSNDEKNEETEGRNSQETDECISPIMSQETFQTLHSLAPLVDLNVFSDLDCDPVLFSDSEPSSQLTKLYNIEFGLPPNSQPQPPQGSLTQGLSIPVPTKTETQQDSTSIPRQNNVQSSTNSSPFLNKPGVYGFDLSFHGTGNSTKSPPYAYSQLLDKHFILFDARCPISFSFTSEPPFGCLIRAMMYFKDPVDVQYPVEKCNFHLKSNNTRIAGSQHAEHILQCDLLDAMYEKDPISGRCSVTVPYRGSCSAAQFNMVNYTFTCFSSCSGGIYRRPTVVVFTLEHGGVTLGQKVIDVKICACPGRDKEKSEEKSQKKSSRNKAVTNDKDEEKSLKRNEPGGPKSASRKSQPPPGKKLKSDDDLVTVSIQFEVKGRRKAEYCQLALDSIKKSMGRD